MTDMKEFTKLNINFDIKKVPKKKSFFFFLLLI